MRLPPLNAVRTFEAAGRLQNFSAAALELSVTPGAVSRQIKHLEATLGVALFDRQGTEVRLSARGQTYLREIQEALRQIEIATGMIAAPAAVQPLRIWGSRYFIRLWLLPRLPDFQAAHPDLEVTITTVMPNDPVSTEADVAIRIGEGKWPGMKADLLMRRILTPVCSPRYLKNAPALRGPENLREHILLETTTDTDDWRRWQACTGSTHAELGRRIVFTSTDVAYSAALDGLGIVLGRRHFIESDLEKGNLVAPFETDYVAPGGFYLVYPDRETQPRRVILFRNWILGMLDKEQGAT